MVHSRVLSIVLSIVVVLFTITPPTLVYSYLNQDPSTHRVEIGAPDFSSFTSAKDKKDAFFGYLLPMIQDSNRVIIEKRKRLEKIAQNLERNSLKKSDSKFLSRLTREYNIAGENLSDKQKIEILKLRVDQIPASLALSQAAKESGWGTSRFARDANNYFGQWCYKKGCGLVPRHRPEGATHEIRAFDRVTDSVDAYLNNINTHNAYGELRKTRAELRQQNMVSGLILAEQLGKYSQRGKTYVKEIQSMIRFNTLDKLDQSIEVHN